MFKLKWHITKLNSGFYSQDTEHTCFVLTDDTFQKQLPILSENRIELVTELLTLFPVFFRTSESSALRLAFPI